MKHKKLLAILTLVCFMFTLVPVAAFAEEQTSLPDAVDGVITLTGKVTLTEGVEIAAGETLTIDLASFTISYASSVEGSDAAITNKGNLTITDSSEAKTGTITYNSNAPSTSYGYATNTITNLGTLTVEGGTIENTNAYGSASYAIDNNSTTGNATLTVTDGVITSNNDAIRQFANSESYDNTVNIVGGSITGDCAVWIQLPSGGESQNATLNIKDGIFNGGVYSSSHGPAYTDVTINISGGTFKNVVTLGGYYDYYKGADCETVTISGGTFEDAISCGTPTHNISITGGTFAAAPSAYVADGYKVVNNGSNYTVKEKETFTVTWLNADGTELEVDENVVEGTTPEYNGETPTKAADAQYTYTFADRWTPEVSEVTGNVTYTAVYETTINTYTVTWVDEDGTELETDENVAYGATPSYDGGTPTKAATAENTYTFAGWTPEVSEVTGDVTYTATYAATGQTYTVTWVDEDGITVLEKDENVVYGATPSYDGGTPTKDADDEYTYTFAGWTPAIAAVTGDVTYEATYVSIAVEKEEIEVDVVTPAEPEVNAENATVTGDLEGVDVETVVSSVIEAITGAAEGSETVGTTLTVEGEGLDAASKTVAETETVSADSAVEALAASNVAVEKVEDVKVVVQPYMEIKVVDIAATVTTGSAVEITGFTVNITPMYNLVATTAVISGDAKEEVKIGENAVTIGDAQKLEITERVTVAVPLPTKFAAEDETLYVKHVKNGINYVYEGTVTSGILTFLNPHGFSEFTITRNVPGAVIEEMGYETLQDALNDAVTGDVITINSIEGLEELRVTDTKFVTLVNGTGSEITVNINGKPITIEAGGEKEFSYTRPYSGSGGGFTGVYNYPVNVVETTNGTLKADQFSAVKGETVIVTATPKNGFGTAAVIVTDGDDDTIAVTDLQNGTYSFVMPEGEVDVTAVFKGAVTLKIGDTKMNVFGKTVVNDVAPQIKGDYTMLPIRPVVEALDGDVAWDPDTQKITVKLNGNTVVMYVGEKVGYINGAATEMDVPSYIDNSRALYQLRFVAEATDTNIYWNKATYEVTLIPE